MISDKAKAIQAGLNAEVRKAFLKRIAEPKREVSLNKFILEAELIVRETSNKLG